MATIKFILIYYWVSKLSDAQSPSFAQFVIPRIFAIVVGCFRSYRIMTFQLC